MNSRQHLYQKYQKFPTFQPYQEQKINEKDSKNINIEKNVKNIKVIREISPQMIKHYIEFIQKLETEYAEFNSIRKTISLLRKWLDRYQHDLTNNNLKKEGFYILFYLFTILHVYLKFFKENPIYNLYLIRYDTLFNLLFKEKERWFLEHLFDTIQKDDCIDLKIQTIHYYLRNKK